jgi:glycosyltransferase involved in cell wall biosynthesis
VLSRASGEGTCVYLLRIAFVQFQVLSSGGAERFLDQVLARLGLRHEVGVFAIQSEPTSLASLDSATLYGPGPIHLPNRILRSFLKRKRIEDLLHAINRYSPDVLVVSSPDTLRYASWLSRQSGVPTIVIVHSQDDTTFIDPHVNRLFERSQSPLVRFYRNWVTPRGLETSNLRGTRLAICVSHYVESAILSRFPGTRTAVIYGGVDHEHFSPTWEDEDYVLSVSRFAKEKNLELLIEALKGSKTRAVLYGSVEARTISTDSVSYYKYLRDKAGANISLEVHRNQHTLLRRMQTCSMFLSPCPIEGFGLSALEAMACGKVVLGLNSGGTPESVGSAGFLLGNKPDDWRSQIYELMKSKQLRQELGVRAREWSRQFTWERTTEEFETTLKLLM